MTPVAYCSSSRWQAGVAVGLAFVSGTVAILGLAALLGIGFAIAQPADSSCLRCGQAGSRTAVEMARYVGFTVGPRRRNAAAAGDQVAMIVNALTSRRRGCGSDRSLPDLDSCLIPSGPEIAPGRSRYVQDRVLAVVGRRFRLAPLHDGLGSRWQSSSRRTTSTSATPAMALSHVLDARHALGATLLPRRVAPGMLALAALAAIAVQLRDRGTDDLASSALAFTLFFVGAWPGTKNVLVRTLIRERVPPTLHGRAYAAYNALRNGAELVALVGGGFLVAALGARWTLFLAGAVPMAAGLVALALSRRRLTEAAVSGAAA
jgi:hypothetical protein